jgi:hypothetical protein
MIDRKTFLAFLVLSTCSRPQASFAQSADDLQRPRTVTQRVNVTQKLAPTETAEQARLKALAKSLPDVGRPYSMRVTVGASNNAGFENALVNSDPSLRHWCWIPVTSFRQATVGVDYKHTQMPGRPEHVYSKPTHVPLPTVDHGPMIASQPIGSHYVKPIQVPLPGVDHGLTEAVVTSRAAAAANVSGKVKLPHTQVPAVAHAIAAKTYGESYGQVSGSIRPSYSGPSTDDLRVKGRLLKP